MQVVEQFVQVFKLKIKTNDYKVVIYQSTAVQRLHQTYGIAIDYSIKIFVSEYNICKGLT